MNDNDLEPSRLDFLNAYFKIVQYWGNDLPWPTGRNVLLSTTSSLQNSFLNMFLCIRRNIASSAELS